MIPHGLSMIPMQRSLSSPVAIHSSPPRSPTTARDSRWSSPYPGNHGETSRPRRFRSRSPPQATGEPSCFPSRRSEDLPRRASMQQTSTSSSKPKAVVEQAGPTASPASELNGSSGSLETGRDVPSPSSSRHGTSRYPAGFIPDPSLYWNAPLEPEIQDTSLEELAHLVRLSRYQERKCANTRIRLQRMSISTALSARLTRCGDMVHRNLVDSFRGDDKKLFAALYNAFIDVRKSCDETRRFALLDPDTELRPPPGLGSPVGLETTTGTVTGASAPISPVAPFLGDISASARETFLNFLTQIRTNPDYLATRLASLNSAEFAALSSFHQSLEPVESVLPFHSRTSGRGGNTSSSGSVHSSPFVSSSGNRSSAQERGAIERLLSFQRHDPISALIHTCFASSAGPDSAEDQRRTSIWANACARLMSSSATGSESVVMSVLNAWVSMRDWAGKSNMEWYLMKILEDGAFLLDRAEDQHGTRFNLSDWTAKDQMAADEFYARAVDELFDVIDDEDATGIPEGLVELGNEIVKRLDKKLVDSVRRWLVAKYLFTSWLLGVVVHPEAYGMMAEYHITEYGRQKILKTVAMHAQKLVLDLSYGKTPVSTPSGIKSHVENIYGRFEDSRDRRKPRLLPARSITSLRETSEVHPYLVISAADLATMVNALFPQRRPQSAQSGSLRSAVSAFSTVSQPALSRTPQGSFDTMSVASTSVESIISDATTSKEPLLDGQNASPHRYSPSINTNYEEDGYQLRLAMREMSQSLGPECMSGSCHPCAERWAVVFISADGTRLSTQMTYDVDEDVDEEGTSSAAETDEDDVQENRPELDKDYHQLRDTILRLVEEFEIPHSVDQGGKTKQTFSNRASTLKKYRSRNKIIAAETSMGSRNPYRKRSESMDGRPSESLDKSKEEVSQIKTLQECVLEAMLTAASSQARAQSDFVSAHQYWRTLQQLHAISSESLRQNNFAVLLNILSRSPQDSIRRCACAIEEYDAWLVWLKQSQERAEGLIETMMRRLRALRDKMWYVTDVRNSAPYEDSRNVAIALKTMGMPRRWHSFQRMRNMMQRGPASSYMFRTESQVLDLMAAPEEQGGPNKLRDDQVERSARWLEQNNVENFCRGEERLHRFCCEVDSCVGKLVGDNIMDGPVLWSSELYLRDGRIFEIGRHARDGDSHAWDDSASAVGDLERRYASVGRASSTARDLRTMSMQNLSQQSFDSGRFSFSKASTVLSDVADGSDYFTTTSSMHAIDASNTFWSPFRHGIAITPNSMTPRTHSPMTSVTNVSTSFVYPDGQKLTSQSYHSSGRPGTSAWSTEVVFQQRLHEEKSGFLVELRQTLTSLLLSDLGNLVFARGSETDAWFESLGQECIDGREEVRRRSRECLLKAKKTAKKKPKQRVIGKKKSFGNLRGVGMRDPSGDDKTVLDQASTDAAGGSSVGHDSFATSDSTSAKQQSRKDAVPEFPFTKSYQRLLRMFSVHPNPFTKLKALSELEQLMVASLNSASRRSRPTGLRSELGSSADENGGAVTTGRAQALDEAMDKVKERRSHNLMKSLANGPGVDGRVGSGTGNVDMRPGSSVSNTDAVANMLLQLFRDPTMRPKTLFRDLQFIAAFVPASVLDKTELGKAFWDIGVAVLGLKQDVCGTMVEVADGIVGKYTQPRNGAATGGGVAAESPCVDKNTRASPPPLPLTSYSLADAARLWTVTAKEGNPTAQRELALFYLSNPELVERTTLPLSKPRDVFKQAIMEKYGGRNQAHAPVGPGGTASQSSGMGLTSVGAAAGGSGSVGVGNGGAVGKAVLGRVGTDVRSDPALMCIAIHWMEAATQGGDELARTFLGQNGMGEGLLG